MKGQSAVEYIMTYGWALLILAIVIALIISSGIFSPSYLISEECNLGPKLPCRFFLSSEGGSTTIDMEIDNGFGYTIHITEIRMEMDTYGALSGVSGMPQQLQSGETVQVSAVLQGRELGSGSNQRIRVHLGYYSCALEVNPDCSQPTEEFAFHTITGRIVGKVN